MPTVDGLMANFMKHWVSPTLTTADRIISTLSAEVAETDLISARKIW